MNEDKELSYRELIIYKAMGSSLSILGGGPLKFKDFIAVFRL